MFFIRCRSQITSRFNGGGVRKFYGINFKKIISMNILWQGWRKSRFFAWRHLRTTPYLSPINQFNQKSQNFLFFVFKSTQIKFLNPSKNTKNLNRSENVQPSRKIPQCIIFGCLTLKKIHRNGIKTYLEIVTKLFTQNPKIKMQKQIFDKIISNFLRFSKNKRKFT